MGSYWHHLCWDQVERQIRKTLPAAGSINAHTCTECVVVRCEAACRGEFQDVKSSDSRSPSDLLDDLYELHAQLLDCRYTWKRHSSVL